MMSSAGHELAYAALCQARQVIPYGFDLKAGHGSQHCVVAMDTVHQIILTVALMGDVQRQTHRMSHKVSAVDERALMQWARTAAKAMAHELLMAANPVPDKGIPTPTPRVDDLHSVSCLCPPCLDDKQRRHAAWMAVRCDG